MQSCQTSRQLITAFLTSPSSENTPRNPISAMAQQLNTEFVSNLPLEQSWKMAKHSDHILPKVLPHVFAKSERLEGDGGAGTVRIVTLGDGKYIVNEMCRSIESISLQEFL